MYTVRFCLLQIIIVRTWENYNFPKVSDIENLGCPEILDFRFSNHVINQALAYVQTMPVSVFVSKISCSKFG